MGVKRVKGALLLFSAMQVKGIFSLHDFYDESVLLELYCGNISLIGSSFTEECAEGPKWAGVEKG